MTTTTAGPKVHVHQLLIQNDSSFVSCPPLAPPGVPPACTLNHTTQQLPCCQPLRPTPVAMPGPPPCALQLLCTQQPEGSDPDSLMAPDSPSGQVPVLTATPAQPDLAPLVSPAFSPLAPHISDQPPAICFFTWNWNTWRPTDRLPHLAQSLQTLLGDASMLSFLTLHPPDLASTHHSLPAHLFITT